MGTKNIISKLNEEEINCEPICGDVIIVSEVVECDNLIK